jgi:hypothetical protein
MLQNGSLDRILILSGCRGILSVCRGVKTGNSFTLGCCGEMKFGTAFIEDLIERSFDAALNRAV